MLPTCVCTREVVEVIFSNPCILKNPKKGSMHNQGMAIVATLVDQNGQQLNMGTSFDSLGKQSHFDCPVTDQNHYKKQTFTSHGHRKVFTKKNSYRIVAFFTSKTF